MRRLRLPISLGVSLTLGAGLGMACKSDDDDVVAEFFGRLQECGLLSEGELPSYSSSDAEFESAEEECFANCVLAANCEDLEWYWCDGDGAPSTDLLSCQQGCLDAHGFTCGDGSKIFSGYQCDGDPDCADASDEEGCPTFECADGSGTQPADYQCDGYPDCDDGSDEEGCPGFQCADGSATYPEDYQCDGYQDCSDGSDEAGCPVYTCANGQEVGASARCNLFEDCEDGSDEEGCAQDLCP